MNCRLCATAEVSLFSRQQRDGQNFTLLYCPACQVVQSLEHHEAVSPDYVTLAPAAIDQSYLWCQAEHKKPAFRQWQQITQPYWSTPPGQLLDVGCDTGGFLAYAASQGWQPFGFDASLAQAQHAQQQFALVRHASSSVWPR